MPAPYGADNVRPYTSASAVMAVSLQAQMSTGLTIFFGILAALAGGLAVSHSLMELDRARRAKEVLGKVLRSYDPHAKGRQRSEEDALLVEGFNPDAEVRIYVIETGGRNRSRRHKVAALRSEHDYPDGAVVPVLKIRGSSRVSFDKKAQVTRSAWGCFIIGCLFLAVPLGLLLRAVLSLL
ncbi:hypothetical protein IT575_15190 [bacterium]|nr:hypothetical protein [bacterium]